MTILFLGIPAIISSFFGLKFLLSRNEMPIASKILGAYFFMFTIILITLIISSELEGSEAAIVNLFSLLFFVALIAIPPTVCSYSISLTDFKFKKISINHYYLPLGLLLINLLSFIYLSSFSDEEDFIFTVCQNVMDWSNAVALFFIFPILNIFYIYKTLVFYREHKKKIGDVFSYEEGINLKWMLNFILGYILFISSTFIVYLSPINQALIPVGVFMSGYLIYVGIKGGKQQIVKFKTPVSPEDSVVEITPESSIEKKTESLDSNKKEVIKKAAVAVMQTEKPYLNSKLTIHELAKLVGTNSKYLSSILNSEFKMNFVSFVNKYRIEDSKNLLISEENKNLTIEAIAEMAGFNSKSAFNNAFKILTKETPSSFRKKHL